jgi:hypothetical protein
MRTASVVAIDRTFVSRGACARPWRVVRIVGLAVLASAVVFAITAGVAFARAKRALRLAVPRRRRRERHLDRQRRQRRHGHGQHRRIHLHRPDRHRRRGRARQRRPRHRDHDRVALDARRRRDHPSRGAIANGEHEGDGTLDVSESTLTGDHAFAGGAAIDSHGPVEVVSSTLYQNYGEETIDNAATNGGEYQPFSIEASIVAGSETFYGPAGTDCAGPIEDAGFNYENDSSTSCGFSEAAGDVLGGSPELGALAYNGGPTETLEPSHDSPVVEHIPNPTFGRSALLCPAVDQRGEAGPPERVKCSIGSVDVYNGSVPPLRITTKTLPNAIQGSEYQQQVAITGGPGGRHPYQWSVSAGALPPGLSQEGPWIVGIPETAGTYKFRITVTEPTAGETTLTASRAFTLQVT